MSDSGYTPSKEEMIALREVVEGVLSDAFVSTLNVSVKSAQVVLSMRDWLAAHDAGVRADERRKTPR